MQLGLDLQAHQTTDLALTLAVSPRTKDSTVLSSQVNRHLDLQSHIHRIAHYELLTRLDNLLDGCAFHNSK